MEQVLERETATQERKIYDWRDIEMYDEDGTQIKNPDTLMAIAEAMELADEWERRVERCHFDEILGRDYDDDDGEEEE